MKIIKLGHALALAGVLSLGTTFSLDVQAAECKPKAGVAKELGVSCVLAGMKVFPAQCGTGPDGAKR